MLSCYVVLVTIALPSPGWLSLRPAYVHCRLGISQRSKQPGVGTLWGAM